MRRERVSQVDILRVCHSARFLSDDKLTESIETVEEPSFNLKSIYGAWEDSRIEPHIVSMKRFREDDTSPLLEIVRQQGVEIRF